LRQLAQRLGVLAAVALIALLVAGELTHKLGGSNNHSSQRIQAVPAPGSSWNGVLAGIMPLSQKGEKTACGVTVGPDTYGVAHPSLPCGTRIFIAYGHTQVLAEVLARGPYVPGRGLDLTPALAKKLGFTSDDVVRWRFSQRKS
jgi:rare lipoprotein A (peptidoglycan hydrolase)